MTTALSKLLSLESSWYTSLASVENTEVSHALFLIHTGAQFAFVHKNKVERGAFLERFFLGEPEGQNFTAILAKIRNLYSQINWRTITPNEESNLHHLELSLNLMGRHVFALRETSFFTLFDSYTFANFRLEYRKLPEILPPPCTTKRALNNSTGSICWLNSFLKYVTLSPLYDHFLVTNHVDEAKEELRTRLHRVITALRQGWQQPVINALQQELLDFLRTTPSFSRLLRGQQDAFDFARLLHTQDVIPAETGISSATIFTSLADNVMKPGVEHKNALRVEIAATRDATIDLQIGFSREDLVQDVKEYFIKKGDVWQNATNFDDPLVFTKKDICLHLPEYFEILLKRGFIAENNKNMISNQLIEMTPEGTVLFLQSAPCYELIEDRLFLKNTTITAIHTYKVMAAIERFGSNENSGHFVAHLRNEDGSISTHNDARIQTNSSESVWKTASLLTLKRISTKYIGDNNDTSNTSNAKR